MGNIRTMYDVHYDLEDYKDDGAAIIKFVTASYEIEIIRPHDSMAIESTIKYIGIAGDQKFMEVLPSDPDNEYTQIVAREVSYLLFFSKKKYFCIFSIVPDQN